jgi:hypothetical protein
MEKRQWKVGWRRVGYATETPTYFEGVFDSFMDANEYREEMANYWPEKHFFVDVVPSETVKKLDKETR